MRTFFFGNFDFEHRLGAVPERQLPAFVRRIDAELACVWLAVAEDGDLVWTPESIDPEFWTRMAEQGLPLVEPIIDCAQVSGPARLCPWGWTDQLRRWGERHSCETLAPPQSAVRAANSRRLSFRLEREWGNGLEGSAQVTSLDEFAAAVRALPHERGWVAKAEFSMSARERILGRGEPTAAERAWAARRLKADGVVFVEPWVEAVEELGLQWTVPPSGEPIFEGLAPLLTNTTGHYRGSRIGEERGAGSAERGADESEVSSGVSPGSSVPRSALRAPSSALALTFRVAQEVQRLGYFGPLGIDAMHYRDGEGNLRLRAVQDINARWTMGRLSLGFRRLLGPGECGTWLHPAPECESAAELESWFEGCRQKLPRRVRLMMTSPWEIGGSINRHPTLLLIAPGLPEQRAAEDQLLGKFKIRGIR